MSDEATKEVGAAGGGDVSDEEAMLWQFAARSFDRTLKTLEELRQRLCAYCAPGQVPGTCDCRYANLGSHGRPLGTGDVTGCPEIREAMDVLRLGPQLRAVLAERYSLEVRLSAAEAVNAELKRALTASPHRANAAGTVSNERPVLDDDLARGDVERLREALTDVLSRFIQEESFPKRGRLRIGSVSAATLDRWRAVAYGIAQ